MKTSCSVLVVGGGLVGTSLAIALDQAGIDVILVEARSRPVSTQADPEERNLALARASVNGLRHLGVWRHAASEATPIRSIQVSRQGVFGSARLQASAIGVDALGYTLPARVLGAALAARLGECTRVRHRVPAKVIDFESEASGWRVRLAGEKPAERLYAGLLVGADGTSSSVRDALGIGTDDYDYEQVLMVGTVRTDRSLEGRAFERFTGKGPVALLPLAQGRTGLVLTVSVAEAEAVAAMDERNYLQLAQARFGWRMGRFVQAGRRQVWPIRRVAAQSICASRAVLVGNAAQTIHPIGAQGFNLGLRDALTLAELLAVADDPGAESLLTEYATRRKPDRDGVMRMSHGLVRLACLPEPAWHPLYSLGLGIAGQLSPLRHAILRRGMGFRGHPPQAVVESLP